MNMSFYQIRLRQNHNLDALLGFPCSIHFCHRFHLSSLFLCRFAPLLLQALPWLLIGTRNWLPRGNLPLFPSWLHLRITVTRQKNHLPRLLLLQPRLTHLHCYQLRLSVVKRYASLYLMKPMHKELMSAREIYVVDSS